MSIYDNYASFVENITGENITISGFKSNARYTYMLEHVSKNQGEEYLRLVENEYSNIEFSNVLEFLKMNDTYGSPVLFEYTNKNGITFKCSSTSLRYVYQSLVILKHYVKTPQSMSIVEVGCGYGGLFLAIQFFSRLQSIVIPHYYFVDLDPVGKLVGNYLNLHKTNISVEYSIHSASLYGIDISDSNLFLVSNYCFTEIENSHRNNYISTLIPKCISGFIIWQTCACDIATADSFITVKYIEEERPQTAGSSKNYFLYF
ncbi:MAG: hypothetical protein EBS86_05425 [Crocinitomicaceae bacterium]|nr:hypothetical protein [Crocinitomicaceae bacterium]